MQGKSYQGRFASFILSAVALSAFAQPPPGYYESAAGKTGSELRAALHEIINDHTVLSYSGGTNHTGIALAVLDEDPANTNNVILIYSSRSEPKSTFGLTTGWNREHLWPNSYGLDDNLPAFSDLHNLRAVDSTVNSARGNKFYDFSDLLDANYRNPAHAEALICTTDSDSWEAGVDERGDIARALFYMDVRYEGDRTNELDFTLTEETEEINSDTNLMGHLRTLLLWHESDEVSAAERLRNDIVYERYQQNRNPFVDRPEWVDLIFKPRLEVRLAESVVEVRWSTNHSGYVLERSPGVGGAWVTVTNEPSVSNGSFVVGVSTGLWREFLRLRGK